MSGFLILVEDNVAGQRLDRWLRAQFPHFKQAFIEKSLRKGLIRINGEKITAAHRLVAGENISIAPNLTLPPTPSCTRPEKTLSPLNLEERQWLESLTVWEDNDLLVLNKPAGLAVQGGTKMHRHIDGLLQAYGVTQAQRYYLVHRLDRDTSGLLIVAKNQSMAQHLSAQFQHNTVKKLYLAVVLGPWKHPQGTIDAPLMKLGVHEKMVVEKEKGRHAQTDFRLIKRLAPHLDLLALTPHTGRTHQLRVHMSYMGHPIIGDGKYGGRPALKQAAQLHLHAYRLTIKDKEGTPLTFTAPIPEHFLQTLETMGINPVKALGNL